MPSVKALMRIYRFNITETEYSYKMKKRTEQNRFNVVLHTCDDPYLCTCEYVNMNGTDDTHRSTNAP